MKYHINEPTFKTIKNGKAFTALITITPPTKKIPVAIKAVYVPAFNSFSNLHLKVEQFAKKFYELKGCHPKNIKVETIKTIR